MYNSWDYEDFVEYSVGNMVILWLSCFLMGSIVVVFFVFDFVDDM